MAISTYSELQTAVARWLSRENQSGFSDRVPEFISLAESFLNSTLPLRINIVDTTLTATASVDYIALPSDFVVGLAMRHTTTPYELLTQCAAGDLPIISTEGRPLLWAVDESSVSFERACDSAYTFRFRYRKRFALSVSATTNWLLTNCPDVYLWASLYEASGYIDDGASYAATTKARRDEAVVQARALASRSVGLATLQSDPALVAIGSRRAGQDWYPVTFS
jgi:hypothetical protein